jgi:hypothetical protein
MLTILYNMHYTLHILSNNFTNLKKIKIQFDSYNICDLLNFLYDNNHIDTTNYSIYHNNNVISNLSNLSKLSNLSILDDISLILKENKFIMCSCCINH